MNKFLGAMLIIFFCLAQLTLPTITCSQASEEPLKVSPSSENFSSNPPPRDQRKIAIDMLTERIEGLNETMNSRLQILASSLEEIRNEIIQLQTSPFFAWSGALAALLSVVVAFLSVRTAAKSARSSQESAERSLRTTQEIARDSDKLTRYTYLANKWYDLKEKELNFPKFADREYTENYRAHFSGTELAQYNIFAWMCWGHSEDVYKNGWHNDIGFAPTIHHYKQLHINWLLDEENESHFARDFLTYVQSSPQEIT